MDAMTTLDALIVVALFLLFATQAYTVRLFLAFRDDTRGSFEDVRAGLQAITRELTEHDREIASLAREVFRRRDGEA